MFYTPGLFFPHLPRMGGTFIKNMLEKHLGGSSGFGQTASDHDGIRKVPPHVLESCFTFGCARDPWSWYASIDAHYRQKKGLDGFMLDYYGTRRPSYKENVLGMTQPSSIGLRPDIHAHMPGQRDVTQNLSGMIESSGLGLWSIMMISTFSLQPFETIPDVSNLLRQRQSNIRWDVDALIDHAQLRDGLCTVLLAFKPDISQQALSDIQQAPPANAKNNGRGTLPNGKPDPGMYDSEAIEAVLAADGLIMEQLGLHLPVGSPDRPAVRQIHRSS